MDIRRLYRSLKTTAGNGLPSASALLAGATHTCANGVTGNYCSDAAPPALHTDQGDLYLSDLMYADPVTGNVGIFLIEVGNDDTL